MIRLYNTATQEREEFAPGDPKAVTFYACGPTVYDTPHIGNARSAVVMDVVFRTLRSVYPAVQYVRNITDVDDKIIAASRERGIGIRALTAESAAIYARNLAALGALVPSHEPRVTDHIPDIIAFIAGLIGSDHAYAIEGHVYFDTRSSPHVNVLSRHHHDDLLAGHRVAVGDLKRHPQDFVLWKPSDDPDHSWPSPWGQGRPGWHIECSAMIRRHLGITIDLHGGGQDLVFPHHDCEIAQSQSRHDAPLARYWLHNGLVTVDGKKMSKSLGNFITVDDALARYPGDSVRFYLLSTHYRQPLDWSWEGLARAHERLDRLRARLPGLRQAPGPSPLWDDFNTPQALTELEAALAGNREPAGMAMTADILGIVPKRTRLTAEQMRLLRLREDARRIRDWAASDQLRQQLAEQGIVVKDTQQGPQVDADFPLMNELHGAVLEWRRAILAWRALAPDAPLVRHRQPGYNQATIRLAEAEEDLLKAANEAFPLTP